MRVVAAGESLLSPSVTRRVIAELATGVQAVIAAYEAGLVRPGED